jgi:hypothetical protein
MRSCIVDDSFKLEELRFSLDDPLANELTAVAAWVEDAFATLSKFEYYEQVDLKSLPSGNRLLEGKPDQLRRYVLAAVAQVRHWDQQTEQIRAQATTEIERMNPAIAPSLARRMGAASPGGGGRQRFDASGVAFRKA